MLDILEKAAAHTGLVTAFAVVGLIVAASPWRPTPRG